MAEDMITRACDACPDVHEHEVRTILRVALDPDDPALLLAIMRAADRARVATGETMPRAVVNALRDLIGQGEPR